jgi:FkbM family methyltransferase
MPVTTRNGWRARQPLHERIHASLQRFGVDLIRYPAGTSYGVAFYELTVSQQADAVVDVGANTGQFSAMLRERGFRGLLVCFEPASTSFAALARRAEDDPFWHVEQLALGDRDDIAELTVTVSSNLSSLLPTSAYGQIHFGAEIAVQQAEHVPVRRLDESLPDLIGDASRLMLKIDTQGFDQRVLDGAEEILDRVVGIQTEVAIRHYYEGAPSYLDRLRWLDDRGFEPVSFLPAAGCWDEVDVLLTRSSG